MGKVAHDTSLKCWGFPKHTQVEEFHRWVRYRCPGFPHQLTSKNYGKWKLWIFRSNRERVRHFSWKCASNWIKVPCPTHGHEPVSANTIRTDRHGSVSIITTSTHMVTTLVRVVTIRTHEHEFFIVTICTQSLNCIEID